MAAKDADLARDYSLDFVYINNTSVAQFEIELITTPQQSLAGGNPTGDRTEEAFIVPDLGTVLEIELITTPHSVGGGTSLPPVEPAQKSQFISSEPLEMLLRPFLSSDGSLVVSGVDVIALTLKAPDATIFNPVPVWDAVVNMWVAQLDVADFQEGEWLLYGVSSVGSSLPQFMSLWWGDYVDDIPETRQAAVGRWKIIGTTLNLYEDNGVTIFKSFDLKDDVGAPSYTRVFDKDPI